MNNEVVRALIDVVSIYTNLDQTFSKNDKETFVKYLLINHFYLQASDVHSSFDVQDSSSSKDESIDLLKTQLQKSFNIIALTKAINNKLNKADKILLIKEFLHVLKITNKHEETSKQFSVALAERLNISEQICHQLEMLVFEQQIQNFTQKQFSVFYTNEKKTEAVLCYKVPKLDLLFFKWIGRKKITYRGRVYSEGSVVQFERASYVELNQQKNLYYSDVISYFNKEHYPQFVFEANQIEYLHSNSYGFHAVNIAENAGNLVGIIGGSGAGKTTLMNVLSGVLAPQKGSVQINQIDISQFKVQFPGVLGYIPQDDLLIEDISVFENLYYAAKLSLGELSDEAIKERVDRTLKDLGLFSFKDLKVGSVYNHSLSGGQRKRLNIALELIREPSILFVDEPTSGLSSRDSELVINLLKELTSKGKLVFVVIHQPSSTILKMFDKVVFLDQGGYQIFYGHPIDTIKFFNSYLRDEQHLEMYDKYGAINIDILFNIVEEEYVDEHGLYTGQRKVSPQDWHQNFLDHIPEIKTKSNNSNWDDFKILKIATPLQQFITYLKRDIKSKINNHQYTLISVLEAPLLAFILALLVRYNNSDDGISYIYRYNQNINAYLLMCVIVSLFLGLTNSAEEIINDRKNLKRESFIGLNKLSYLKSKIVLLFILSAYQAFVFVSIGNSLLEIKGMYISYFFMMFSVSCFANMLGLNLSASFSNTVSIYIAIPLIIIPQMILSGAMFNYDNINDLFKNKAKVPVVADLMVSRWAYEGLCVEQYTENRYAKFFYDIEKHKQIALFNEVYAIPHLKEGLYKLAEKVRTKQWDQVDVEEFYNPSLRYLLFYANLLGSDKLDVAKLELALDEVKLSNIDLLTEQLQVLDHLFNEEYNKYTLKEDILIKKLDAEFGRNYVSMLKDMYFNDQLSDHIRNTNSIEKLSIYNGYLIPKTENVYFSPIYVSSVFYYRTHFFSPIKNLFGASFSTFYFNLIVVWLFTIVFFITLYFDISKGLINLIKKLYYKFYA